jgi:hypothetical protein
VNRDVVRVLALALLAVLAVGLISATVTDVTDPGPQRGEGGGGGSPGDRGAGDDSGLLPSENREGEPVGGNSGPSTGGSPVCIEQIDTPEVQFGILAALALLFGVVRYQQHGRAAVAVLAVIAPSVGLLYGALLCPSQSLPRRAASEGRDPSDTSGASGVEGGGVPETVFDAPLWLVVLVGAVVVGAVLVAVSRSDGFGSVFGVAGGEETGDVPGTDVAAVGRVAGRAADRIQTGVDADNEVYRAWAAMTEHLDVERPASSTPAEFADAAVAAGIDRADVEELTGLFAAVRYGGEAPTDERERRAVDALRRIEEAYADTAAPDGSNDGVDTGRRAGGDRR